MPGQLSSDLIDSLADYEHRSVCRFREEIPHGPIETPRQENPLSFLSQKRK